VKRGATQSVFEALPGIEVPVGEISRGLAAMWGETAAHGHAAPASEDSKAIQVNFVLLFGLVTTSADAVRQFETAVKFSRRHPSRVVVLCPRAEGNGGVAMRAKVYGECTLGRSKDDKRCCEFVMLSYVVSMRGALENQVSVCLSTDIPLYYWAHGFAHSSRVADYLYLMTRSKRMLIDSATAPVDALTYPWPRPEVVRDLAYARLLPVRQSLGQFLSRYPMGALCEGLKTVTVSHGSAHRAEARVLLAWVKERMDQCDKNRAAYGLKAPAGFAAETLSLTFDYGAAKKKFSWKGDLKRGRALFEADLGSGRTRLPAAVSLLPPENALSEAMFF
jgi:glucose-6-phosphate dehydrogenase assembly protein OpcA